MVISLEKFGLTVTKDCKKKQQKLYKGEMRKISTVQDYYVSYYQKVLSVMFIY